MDDEREKIWRAIGVIDDRVTELKAVVDTRNELMRETITDAVKQSMPTALLNNDQHAYVEIAFQRWKDRAAFRKKVIESAAIWAIPLILLFFLGIVREYAINHGMWKP